MKRLRYMASLNPAVPASVRTSLSEFPIYSMDSIHEFGPPSVPEKRPVGELLGGYSYIEPTDVAYAKVTPCFENGKGVLGSDLDGPSFATTEVTVLRPREGVDDRFLAWLLQADVFREPAIASMTGAGGLRRVPETQIRDFFLPAPDTGNQQAIADYLDHETAEIDRFISDHERLSALLAERRAAALTRAVVASESDGAQREVPWSPGLRTPYPVVNIRRAASMRTGHTPSRSKPEYWEGDLDIPWFTLADVWQLRAGHKHLGQTKESISPIGLANSAAELLPADTVVLSRTASVGFTGIMPRPMTTSQDFWNWVCSDRLLPEYLWLQFRAMRPFFDRIKSGSTHKTIYQADAAGMDIVLPPRCDQRAIAADMALTDATTEALIADSARAITLATERRAALITAAVTGQIDVTATHRPAAEQLEDDIKELT